MKKKILVYGMSNTWGGMEAIILNMSQYLVKYLDMDIMLPDGECVYENNYKHRGLSFIHMPSWGSDRKLFCKRLTSQLERVNYNYIWINSCILANRDIVSVASLFPSIKIITHAHSSSFEEDNIIKRIILFILHYRNRAFYLRKIDYPCMCSEQAGRWLFGKRYLEKNKVLLVNNGINICKYRFSPEIREQYRSDLGLRDEIALFNVGRLAKVKNQIRLIEIAELLASSGVSFRLFIAGDGELRKELYDVIKEKSLECFVSLLGHRDDISSLCQAMDVFILPSLNEGFGMVLAEAQASGLPCVASSTVPIETNVAGLVRYLSLDDSDEVWASAIIDSSKMNINRPEMADVVARKGFDIEQSSYCFLKYINAF